jgi:hypothetical protein
VADVEHSTPHSLRESGGRSNGPLTPPYAPRWGQSTHSQQALKIANRGQRTPSPGVRKLVRGQVADSLDPEAPGIITVTIREESGGKPDVEGLQRDLDRLGVRARIYQGDPSCPVSRQVAGDDIGHDPDGYLVLEGFSASEVVDGGQVAHINPDKIPTGHHLQIVFPVLAEGEGYDGGVAIGLEKDPGPDRVHMPAPGARLEDYALDEDGLTRWRPPAQA